MNVMKQQKTYWKISQLSTVQLKVLNANTLRTIHDNKVRKQHCGTINIHLRLFLRTGMTKLIWGPAWIINYSLTHQTPGLILEWYHNCALFLCKYWNGTIFIEQRCLHSFLVREAAAMSDSYCNWAAASSRALSSGLPERSVEIWVYFQKDIKGKPSLSIPASALY